LGNKSAQKAQRASGRRQERNISARSQVKTDLAKANKLIASGDAKAKDAVAKAISTIDRAAGKKIMHANNAAQHKSRLMKKFNTPAAKPKASKTEKAD
jgi:small subunit ribosomal protein S20